MTYLLLPHKILLDDSDNASGCQREFVTSLLLSWENLVCTVVFGKERMRCHGLQTTERNGDFCSSWCYDGQCKNHIAFWKVHFHFPFCPRHCIIASSVDCEEVSAWSIAWPIGCLIHSSWAASHWLVVNCGSGSFQPRVHGNMDESEGNDWTSLFQICDCDGGVFFRNMIRFLTIKIQKNSVYPCT